VTQAKSKDSRRSHRKGDSIVAGGNYFMCNFLRDLEAVTKADVENVGHLAEFGLR
jgi:hypothetical protein